MDQNIQNYINQARASGQPDEQIKQALLQSGWSQAQINEAFGVPNYKPVSLYQQPQRKGHLIFKLFIFLILVTIICVAGFFAYKYYPVILEKFQKLTSLQQKVSPENQATQTIKENTYKSDKFGFQFNYPPNFDLQENPQGTGAMQLLMSANDGSAPGGWEVQIAKSDSDSYLMGCPGFEVQELDAQKTVSDITVSGTVGRKIQSAYQSKNGPYSTITVCIEKNNTAYDFSTTNDGAPTDYDYTLFDKTIFSIEFTNQ